MREAAVDGGGDARDGLATAARLDARARAVLDAVPDHGIAQLAAAWEAAVHRQEREVDAAIEGSLSLLPRLLRRRVLGILTRGRS